VGGYLQHYNAEHLFNLLVCENKRGDEIVGRGYTERLAFDSSNWKLLFVVQISRRIFSIREERQ
jgi:hypothetical protein